MDEGEGVLPGTEALLIRACSNAIKNVEGTEEDPPRMDPNPRGKQQEGGTISKEIPNSHGRDQMR